MDQGERGGGRRDEKNQSIMMMLVRGDELKPVEKNLNVILPTDQLGVRPHSTSATKELAASDLCANSRTPPARSITPLASAPADELSRRAPRRTGGCILPSGVQERRRPPRAEAPRVRTWAQAGVPASVARRAPGDPPPLHAFKAHAASARLNPVRLHPLCPPTRRRRGCRRVPRRAQPAPAIRRAAAGHLRPRPQKVSCGFIYRWELPTDRPYYSSSSTIERRRDMHPPPMDPEKLKAVIARYSQVGKALLNIAGTILVIGETTAELLYTANKLQLHSVDDVRAKGKEHADMIKVQLAPLRKWAEDTSRKWHYEGNKESKEKPVLDRELSRALSAKTHPN